MFNILGCCMMLPLVLSGVYERVVLAVFPGELTRETIMMHMAFAHSMFNVLNAAFFTTFIGFLEKVSGMITLAREKETVCGPRHLDENLIDTPPLAMAQVVRELVRMMEYAKNTVEKAAQGFLRGDKALLDQVQEQERVIDEFQRGIVAYLIKISELNLDSRESMEYPVLLHSVNDVEKIGDYAANIVKYGEHRIGRGIALTDDAVERIQGMFAVLYQLFDKTIDALRLDSDGRARDAVVLEDRIDEIKRSVREAFVDNLHKGQGSAVVEIYVMDIATTIEKMGDHLISIAKAVLKDLQWDQRVMVSEKLDLLARRGGAAGP